MILAIIQIGLIHFHGCYKLTGTVDPDKFWNKYDWQFAPWFRLDTFLNCISLNNYLEIPIPWGGIYPPNYEFTLNYFGDTKEQIMDIWMNANLFGDPVMGEYWPYDHCSIIFDRLQANPGNLSLPQYYDEQYGVYYRKLVLPENIEDGTYRTEIVVQGYTWHPETGEQIKSGQNVWVCNVVVNTKVHSMPQYFDSLDSWNPMTFSGDGYPYGEQNLPGCLGQYGYGCATVSNTYASTMTVLINYSFPVPSRIKTIRNFNGYGYPTDGDYDKYVQIRFMDHMGNEFFSTDQTWLANETMPDDIEFTTGGTIYFDIPAKYYFELNQIDLIIETE